MDVVEVKTKKGLRIHLNTFLIESIERYSVKMGITNLDQPIVCNRNDKSVSTI